MLNYLVKTISLLLALVCCSSFAITDNPKENSRKSADNEAVTAFFCTYLGGSRVDYNNNKPLTASKVQSAEALVWNAWKDANNNFTEQKLIELESLETAKSGRWNLPAQLETNAVMPYYFGYKGEVNSGDKYPLYLYTHGSGNKSGEWATGLSICRSFKDTPSVYFIPQIPNEGDYYRWWQKAKQFAWEKLLRLALVSESIDPNRVYFFGISEGGYGSQRLASFYADYLAAAGPMAGGEPLKNAPVENCRNIAFSLRTGERDNGFYRNTLTKYTKEEFVKFQKEAPESFIHNVELIPEKGHSIDYNPTTPWLSKYVRNPYPKCVCWENFEMDGQYRTGFYNIFVKERSNDNTDSRTYYEMEIKNNNISLRVDLVTYKPLEVDPKWGIELKSAKTHTPATKGKIIIYLNEALVDLSKPVVLTVNGKLAFRGKVKLDLKNMVNSCAAFYDPVRLYPAAIDVDIASLK